jgi:hypothetical protein
MCNFYIGLGMMFGSVNETLRMRQVTIMQLLIKSFKKVPVIPE